jgi:predicted RNase H-like HicB family nuclease
VSRVFTLEYWADDAGFVGRLREVPGVFSQGDSLKELEENIRDAYQLMLEHETSDDRPGAQVKEIEVGI